MSQLDNCTVKKLMTVDSHVPKEAFLKGPAAIHLVILYRKERPIDKQLAGLIEAQLQAEGLRLFVSRRSIYGMHWARQVARGCPSPADLSPAAPASPADEERIGCWITIAPDSLEAENRPWKVHGRQCSLPKGDSRLGEPSPEPTRWLLWRGPSDDAAILRELSQEIQKVAAGPRLAHFSISKGLELLPRSACGAVISPTRRSGEKESVGGAVPLSSNYYIIRKSDGQLLRALQEGHNVILIRGPRQMGKTSLLARGLQYMRENGATVLLSDFQKFNAREMETIERFYVSLAESVEDSLGLESSLSDQWDPGRSAQENLENYLEEFVLKQIDTQLVWGLDETDRLFVAPYCRAVLDLFRSWQERRARDPFGVWSKLTILIAFATEAHLFLPNLMRSPCQQGVSIDLEDFTREQVIQLNQCYGGPLRNEQELAAFLKLVNGHPFLVRRSLHEMASKNLAFADFEPIADQEEGIFGDHLRRMLLFLSQDPELGKVVRQILAGHSAPEAESFKRLRSAGVIRGAALEQAEARCQIYASYLRRHLC